MKLKLFVLSALCACIHEMSYAQKLVKDEVDKYTKLSTKETSYERLANTFVRNIAFKMRNVEGRYTLILHVYMHDIFSSDEDDYLYLSLDNGQTIKLNCIRGGVAEFERVANETTWFADFTYKISEDQLQQLKDHFVDGVRVDLRDEYITFDKVKEKNAKKLQKAIELVSN